MSTIKHSQQAYLFSEEERKSDIDPSEQAINLLGISKVRGIGPASLKSLCKNYPDLSDVWKADKIELINVLRTVRIKDREKVVDAIQNLHSRLLEEGQRTFDRLKERGIHILVDCHPMFPERLRQIQSRPMWIFVEGDPSLLSRKSLVAVVGTRRASKEGISLTEMLTKELVRWGFTVVSGLAEGIDAAAHSTVLTFGGYTIAVLGNGLNINFPACNTEIRRQIVSNGGAVITDHFPDTMYSAANFVKRNRIIAGLSGAVIPVESKVKSGTAHTIRFAEETHRKIICVIRSEHDMKKENEIPSMLKEKGSPLVDFDSTEGIDYLHSLLNEIEVDATPKKVDEQAQREACYSEVLQVFRKISDKFPLDEKGMKWLISRIKSIAKEHENAH